MPSFVATLPVRFADIDHAGIVYYPRYFNYFHLAFEEFWRARLGGRAYRELLDNRRIGFPTVHATCDFRAPLRFGDSASVELTTVKAGGKSVQFRYVVRREHDQVLCAEGNVVCAVVDLDTFTSVTPPADVLSHLRSAEAIHSD